jgi:hypothetical protein
MLNSVLLLIKYINRSREPRPRRSANRKQVTDDPRSPLQNSSRQRLIH